MLMPRPFGSSAGDQPSWLHRAPDPYSKKPLSRAVVCTLPIDRPIFIFKPFNGYYLHYQRFGLTTCNTMVDSRPFGTRRSGYPLS